MGIDSAVGAALLSEEEADPLARPANDPAFDLLPKPVRVLQLNRGAERVPRTNEESKKDELWLGTAFDLRNPDADDIPVYVRIADPMPIVAELMCSVVGRTLGLPVPQPFIVEIPPDVLQKSKLIDSNKTCMAFASEDMGGSTFSQLLRADSPAAQAMLASWEHLLPVATFDEWMANRDRNLGNIIFAANVLWLIDHAEAFHGTAGSLFELSDLVSMTGRNILAEKFLVKQTSEQCSKHLGAASEWLTSMAKRINIEDAAKCADIDQWRTPEQRIELIDFVTKRLLITHQLLCNRLGHPKLAL